MLLMVSLSASCKTEEEKKLESLFADDDNVETEEFDGEDDYQDEDDDLLADLFGDNDNYEDEE